MPASPRPDIAFDGRATLGEGPVWDEKQQRLVWLDILPGLVHRFDPATGGDHVFRVGKPAGSPACATAAVSSSLSRTASRCSTRSGSGSTRSPSSSTPGRRPGSTRASVIRLAGSWPAPWPMT